jgi:hypothetical protein
VFVCPPVTFNLQNKTTRRYEMEVPLKTFRFRLLQSALTAALLRQLFSELNPLSELCSAYFADPFFFSFIFLVNHDVNLSQVITA